MMMKHQNILDRMTLEDKIALCSGADFWHTKAMPQYGIPVSTLCDGPHGLRRQQGEGDHLGLNESVPATCFPTAAATACSWDADLLREIGEAIGKEAAANEVGVVLGPGVNLKRNPLCGRNFEYFSEDPLLSGKLAAAWVQGAQSTGVAASLKHYACNSQEYKRFSSDSILDDRTLRELYLTAFETAVKEGKAAAVMNAYNKVNGTYCSDSKLLLTDILRNEWGFDGMVVTDWGAMHDRAKGFQAGCDLSMPGGSNHLDRYALQAVKDGLLTEAEIDICADRVLEMIFRVDTAIKAAKPFDSAVHDALACKAAEQSAVLLKNDGILPLPSEKTVALIGDMAKHIRYQGTGSSHINPTQLAQIAEHLPHTIYAQGCSRKGDTTETLLAEAADAAKQADIAVVVAGLPELYESEGFDRTDMQMPEGHVRMIEAVSKANPNTVVVLLCGSSVELPWLPSVKAVLYLALGGQAGGRAAANLLTGKANPCGKLAETWLKQYSDCPSAAYYGSKQAEYREGIYVGYRYTDKAKAEVQFPFGYGLSYSKFAYSNLVVHENRVNATITNVGNHAGAETVQMYIAAPQDGIHRPVKELKGFSKVFLQPGESAEVSFPLEDRSFAIWENAWVVPKGTYRILVGGSSADLPLSAEIRKDGTIVTVPSWQASSWYAAPRGTPSREDWEAMLGRKVPEPTLRKGGFTIENSILEMSAFSFVMRLMKKAMEKGAARVNGGIVDYDNPTYRMAAASSLDCALFALVISSGGTFSDPLARGLIAIANGHFFKGLKIIAKK